MPLVNPEPVTSSGLPGWAKSGRASLSAAMVAGVKSGSSMDEGVAQVGIDARQAAGQGAHGQAAAGGQRAAGEDPRGLHHLLDGVHADDAVLAEERVGDGVVPRHGAGVGPRRLHAFLGPSRP